MDGSGGTLAGRYQLEEVIGRGGMGTVYRAVDQVLGRTVAVKVLSGALADQDPTRVARFEREARAAASLNHPGVVAVYDTGVDEGARFIVMELISGRSLEQVMREEGALEPRRAAAIGAEVADALAAAHAAGIVHRDIKPANVMLAADGSVKVLDFGIARASDSTTLTGAASVVGTASYMSPEQAQGRPADERSDIYALGCVLYALLAGHPPFQGEYAAAVLNQHANLAPSSLLVENGRIAPELDALVLRMLAKSPGARPQTAAEVRDLLAEPLSSARVDPSAATTRLLAPERARSGRRGLAVGAIAAVAAAIAVVVLLAAGGGSPRKAAHRTQPTTRTTGTTTPATSQSTTTTSAVTSTSTAPPTVSGTAGALTALITNDAQSGSIDQQAAQQLSNGLSDILNSYEQGNTSDIQHKLAKLSQQLSQLQQHGDVTSAAAPALVTAVGSLTTALANAPAPTTSTAGGSPPGHGPDGKGPHGGGPPGGD